MIPAPRLPVILIPGIMGSEFEVKDANFNPDIRNCLNAPYSYSQGDTVWINQDFVTDVDIATCGKYLDVLKMDESGQAVYSQIGLKGSIVTHSLDNPVAYYDILNYFQNTKTIYPQY